MRILVIYKQFAQLRICIAVATIYAYIIMIERTIIRMQPLR